MLFCERANGKKSNLCVLVWNIDRNVAVWWILFDTEHAFKRKWIGHKWKTHPYIHWRSRSSNARHLPLPHSRSLHPMPHSSIYQFWNPNTINHKTNKWNKCAAILQCTFPSDSVWEIWARHRWSWRGRRMRERETKWAMERYTFHTNPILTYVWYTNVSHAIKIFRNGQAFKKYMRCKKLYQNRRWV